jgi:ABC-type glycerol-3-phosphate transport system permease component
MMQTVITSGPMSITLDATETSNAITINQNGDGYGVACYQAGTAHSAVAGVVTANGSAQHGGAFHILKSLGAPNTGQAVYALQLDEGAAVLAQTDNPLNNNPTILAINNGAGAAIHAVANGTGYSGLFKGGDVKCEKQIRATTGLGYDLSAFNTVIQLSSKYSSVMLNSLAGSITTHNAALAVGATIGFSFSNSKISPKDIVILNIRNGSGGASVNAYQLGVDAVASGSCWVHITNVSAASLSESIIIGFAIIKCG